MDTIRDYLDSAWNAVMFNIQKIGVVDILDILVVAFLIYKVITWLRGRTAASLAKGILILFVMLLLSDGIGMYALNFLLSNTLELGLLAVVIVFQPELRRALERFGSSSIRAIFESPGVSSDVDIAIKRTVAACEDLSRQKTGALIVFERTNRLDDHIKTGTAVDAELSCELLKNIFFPNASLHDGAVIVRDSRIYAAGCMLPLSENPNLSRDLGMRHRAGIGMSEHSDAVVVIVSEESGWISVAVGGMLKRRLTGETLEKLLYNELSSGEEGGSDSRKGGLLNRLKVKKDA